MRSVDCKSGFTLIELMIVVAIIICLSMIAMPNLTYFLAKAKRAEVYVNLASLAMAQKAYWAEHGYYARTFDGPDGLHWKPSGTINYTYGLSPDQVIVGNLKTPAHELSNAFVNDHEFEVAAAGYINGNTKADVISVDQESNFRVRQSALTL